MPGFIFEIDELRRLMDEGAQVIEVLPQEEYDYMHLPGAIHVPLKDLTERALAQLDKRRPVVAYCSNFL